MTFQLSSHQFKLAESGDCERDAHRLDDPQLHEPGVDDHQHALRAGLRDAVAEFGR